LGVKPESAPFKEVLRFKEDCSSKRINLGLQKIKETWFKINDPKGFGGTKGELKKFKKWELRKFPKKELKSGPSPIKHQFLTFLGVGPSPSFLIS